MSQPKKSKKFPHVIKASLLDKVLYLLFITFYFYLLYLFINDWALTEASNRLLLLVLILGISIGLFIIFIKIFLADSILEDKWIIKTNPFLMKKRIMYEEIKEVSVTSNNTGIRLDLVDRSTVRIYCGNIIEAVKVVGLINSKIKGDKKAQNGK